MCGAGRETGFFNRASHSGGNGPTTAPLSPRFMSSPVSATLPLPTDFALARASGKTEVTRFALIGRPATWAGSVHGFCVLRRTAVGAWPYCTAVWFLRVGTVIGWPTQASEKMKRIVQPGERIGTGENYSGKGAS